MTITENTKITLTVLTTICGGIMWLTVLWYKTDANAQSLIRVEEKIEAKRDYDIDFQKQVIDRLGRIETKLDHKN